MPATYDPIATTTLGSAASSITFSSIPSTYTDLVLVATGRFSNLSVWRMRFNGDTANNYSTTYMYGTGSSAVSGRINTFSNIYVSWRDWLSANNPHMITVNLFSYGTSANKSALINLAGDNTSTDSAGNSTESSISLWRNTSAINQIQIYSSNTTFAAGYTATLYGILRA